MPSPNAASLGKYGDIPVSYNTGVPNVGIPIHTVQDGPLSLPISLSYHAGGLKVGEPCSWVGLGWSLQAGGMISRTVQGRADESLNGYFTMGKSVGVTLDGKCISKDGLENDNAANTNANGDLNYRLSIGESDGEPDIFSFSVGGYNGKFYIEASQNFGEGKVVMIPQQDVKITFNVLSQSTTNVKSLYRFTITTPDGTKYEFGEVVIDNIVSSAIEVTEPFASVNARYANGWYLKRITSADGLSSITLNYAEEIYQYSSKSMATSEHQFFVPNGGYAQTSVNILSYRLSSIVTTNETVNFIAGVDRQDVTTVVPRADLDGGKNAKILSAIEVLNGDKCKRYELNQNYFEDASATKSGQNYTDKRLRLNSVQEKSCGTATPVIEIPPHSFTYYTPTTGDVNYLPNRLSSAIDHWGYFNEATGNPPKSLNIPYTSLQYTTAGQTFNPRRGSSNRETNEEAMKLGTIKQVTYPTGGSSVFEYEANTYWDTEGRKVFVDQPYSVSHQWAAGSCEVSTYTDNILTSPNPSSSFFITIATSGEINEWFYKWETVHTNFSINNSDCNFGGNIAIVSIFQENGQTALKTVTMVGGEGNFTTLTGKLFEGLPNLGGTGTRYRFEMRGRNVGSRFVLQREVVIEKNQNKKIGGLRIKKITTHDGINAANNIVKTYTYDKLEATTGLTKSTGVLYQKPIYGYVYKGILGACGTGGSNSYNEIPRFFENPIVPLSTFEGNHINYNSVRENYVVNGVTQYYTTYDYNNELIEPFKGIPIVPIQPRIGSGELITKTQWSNSGANVASETQTPYADVYVTGANTFIKFNTYQSFDNNGVGSSPISFWSAYKIRTRPQRLLKTVSTVDNVSSTTTYTYDAQNRFYMPTEVETKNSDDKIYKTKTYYAQTITFENHPNFQNPLTNGFINLNMIGIPLRTETYYNGVLQGGSVIEYKNYAAGTNWLPYRSYSINRDNTLKLNVTVDSYSNNLPTQMTKFGYTVPQTYAWDATKRLLSKTYGGLNWAFGYDGTSNLVNKITDENGLIKTFTYDKLSRLQIVKDRVQPDGVTDPQATTTYSYQYKDPSNLYNFVGTSTAFKGITGPLSTKQYMDGLGRPLEVVKENYTPANAHQKNAVTYDVLGRQNKTFLPFESSSLGFQAPSTTFATHPYVLTEFENSPLSRPIKQTHVDNTFVLTSYGANNATDVRVFTQATEGVVTSTTFYAANTLSKTTMTDENNHATEVFKDKLGRVVLTRKFLGTQRVETYNVYDNYGQLVAVLPPGSVNASGVVTYSLIFQYTYDNKNRLVQKKVPGADAQKFYYDNRDLLVLTQDGNMRAENTTKHLGTIYDNLGRVVKTGFAFVSPTQGVDFNLTNAQITDSLTSTIYYANKSWVAHQNAKVLKPTGVTTNRNYVWSYIERRTGLTYTGNPVWTGKQHLMTAGQPQRPILDADVAGVDWSVNGYDGAQKPTSTVRYLYTGGAVTEVRTNQIFEYDNGQRLKNNKYMYTLNGATVTTPTDILSNMVYDYKDQLTEKNIGHRSSHGKYLQNQDYAYNLRGWLTSINSGFLPSSLDYPLFSSTITNLTIGTTYRPLATSGYLTPPTQAGENNPDLFRETLQYANPINYGGAGLGAIYGNNNGNISQVEWQVAGREAQAYTLYYDDLDRLTDAKYTDIHSAGYNTRGWANQAESDNKYKETATYDVRGNILSLNRNGLISTTMLNYSALGLNWSLNAGSFAATDNLAYTYGDSNRLRKVTDVSSATKGFIYANSGNVRDYEYDKNGNLTADRNKGITNITYNYLNLPMVITFTGNRIITFVYDASGAKLQKIVNNNGTVTNYDYVNGVEYKNNILQRIAHTEGSVTRQDNGIYAHEYVLRDHLGNTRVTFSDANNDGIVTVAANELKQINSYYPFGLNMDGNFNGAGGKNKYAYNGKEWNDDFSLGWNDYGARFYDPALARWSVIDPLSEKFYRWSLYNYGMDNPITNIDVKGGWAVSVHYAMTLRALQKTGMTDGDQLNLLSNYTSVFADHPPGDVLMGNNFIFSIPVSYMGGIDYSPTKNSQNTDWNKYNKRENFNIWHSMKSDWEEENNQISDEGAMRRGMSFGWSKIFDAAKSGKKLGELKANSKEIEEFGQGMHALQDAYAHKGVNMKRHDIMNDIYGDTKEAMKITASAVKIYKLMTNDFEGLGNIKDISTNGMSKEDMNKLSKKINEYLSSEKK